VSDITATTPIQVGQCVTVDLRSAPRGAMVVVVVQPGVGVFRKEGETMRDVKTQPTWADAVRVEAW
jgi:hypothetical protein